MPEAVNPDPMLARRVADVTQPRFRGHPVLDQFVMLVRDWCADAGIVINQDILRGAMMATSLAMLRSVTYGISSSAQPMLTELALTFDMIARELEDGTLGGLDADS